MEHYCCMCDKLLDMSTAVPVYEMRWVHPVGCHAAWVKKEEILDMILYDAE